jgi:hypothetical protein
MTRLNLPEKAICPSCSLPQKRSNRLTAQWILVDGKLICKWLIE